MQLINRLVKGIVGAAIGTFGLVGLLVIIEFDVLGISRKEDIPLWLLRSVFLVGLIVGSVYFSKEKWWYIFGWFVIVLLMAVFIGWKYPI